MTTQTSTQNPLISAKRIWDGGEPVVPSCMLPNGVSHEEAVHQIQAKGQMEGTELERLGEIAARVCYDSLGTGRPSAEFHRNILKVNHLSVYEHCVFTVELSAPDIKWIHGALMNCFNRTSLWVDRTQSILKPRITLNLRHVLEWDKSHSSPAIGSDVGMGAALARLANVLAPNIVSVPSGYPSCDMLEPVETKEHVTFRVVEPVAPQEQWITLMMTGSRGFSHELVRHGDWTAISQRSTRYVDENESPWVEHPLTAEYFAEVERTPMNVAAVMAATETQAKHAYHEIVLKLEAWLISKGVDKFTARKQARGAARGYLGNALYTEVVFSASVSQWLHMMSMRACQAADAEIREAFCKALPELQGSRYGAAFAHLTTVPSPDGIGQVVLDSRAG